MLNRLLNLMTKIVILISLAIALACFIRVVCFAPHDGIALSLIHLGLGSLLVALSWIAFQLDRILGRPRVIYQKQYIRAVEPVYSLAEKMKFDRALARKGLAEMLKKLK